ncbi:hypothetical protein HS1genome_1925 [Sulfodiicoccus acidiphilus]|uniref:Polyketide cyclase n=1 Tax=Sulfodiicoccus acidiphilus TaxID=1670455 RepID=A0A348B5T4_9CREN|nr:STK_08120 family protein [Sulfodiicoccus acidiphilus]BBD73536.1 hypothetical protein HS1genome_1925 [Sulfodiicoccus acidiphilus]GGT92465.1 hypothetical protein GCM10007116_07760 [Sulfodiicoccus acidiphilus]
MRVSRSIDLHPSGKDPLWRALSDPNYVFPRLFPPVKQVHQVGGSFRGDGKFIGSSFVLNIYREVRGDEVAYHFVLTTGGKEGSGELLIKFADRRVLLEFQYSGWMENVSGIFFVRRWFDGFLGKVVSDSRNLDLGAGV